MSDYLQQNASYPFDELELAVQYFFVPPAAPEVICQCLTPDGHECGAVLAADRNIVAAHLRTSHVLGGESKEKTACIWRNCDSRPIQRRAMIRHILSVHLGLLRWTCPLCFKTFSRKGTMHQCVFGGGTPQGV